MKYECSGCPVGCTVDENNTGQSVISHENTCPKPIDWLNIWYILIRAVAQNDNHKNIDYGLAVFHKSNHVQRR